MEITYNKFNIEMNKESIKNEIKNWFVTNRPDLTQDNVFTNNLIESIYNEIKSEIENLQKSATLVIIREFLRLYYSSDLFLLLDVMVEEEPYQKLFSEYRAIGFLYRNEIAQIMKIISEKRIIEKYQNLNLDINIYENEKLKKEVKLILNEYIKTQEENAS